MVRRSNGTLGLCSGTFSGTSIGCLGAAIIVLAIVAAIAGLIAMVWWNVLRSV